MMTAPGVHEAVEIIVNNNIKKSGRNKLQALDLASGQGALAQRMFDNGFTHLDAWELDSKQFLPKGIKVSRIDLNVAFPKTKAGKYDLITAVEIIEHLENPYHFMREISKQLAPGGTLILSTPNIESAISRVDFFVNGNFRWFNEDAYRAWGHITPISSWLLDKAARSAGLNIIEKSSNTERSVITYDGGLLNTIKATLGLIAYPFIKGNKKGDINIWVIRKNK